MINGVIIGISAIVVGIYIKRDFKLKTANLPHTQKHTGSKDHFHCFFLSLSLSHTHTRSLSQHYLNGVKTGYSAVLLVR